MFNHLQQMRSFVAAHNDAEVPSGTSAMLDPIYASLVLTDICVVWSFKSCTGMVNVQGINIKNGHLIS